jgi:hypothetical protein
MRILIVVALAALTGACAAPESAAPVGAAQRAATDVRAITFRITSWGHTTERWTIDASGAASLELRGRDVPLQQPLTPQAFTLRAEDFERVRAALAPAQGLGGRNLTCSDGITDAPYGSITWSLADGGEQSVRWYTGCLRADAERDAFFARTREADNVFHELTGTPAHQRGAITR